MDRQKHLKQYFTPYEVAEFMVNNSKIAKGDKIIDPSVGDAVFFKVLLKKGYSNLYGTDIDEQIVAEDKRRYKDYESVKILLGDALDIKSLDSIKNNYFDMAIGNPPFSNQRNKIYDTKILKFYFLRKKKQSIEILFLERFIQLVKEGGQIRIILPINIFSNTNLQYVRNFIILNLKIEAIVSLPRNIFKNTSAKTAILFGVKHHNKMFELFNTRQEYKVKLILIKDKRELKMLRDLSIYNNIMGIMKNIEDIQYRMDPDYYYAELKTRRYLDNSNIQFKKLKELVKIYNGFTKYGEDKKKIYNKIDNTKREKYIILIKAKSISFLGFKDENCFFIRKDEDIFKPSACVKVGDVLVVRVGAGCSGRAFCVINENYLAQVDDWIFILRGSKVNPAFLTFYLNSSIGKEFVNMEKQGTGTMSISKNKLGNVLVPILDLEQEEEFERLVIKMYDLYEKNEIKKARNIYKILDKKLKEIVRLKNA